MAACYPLNDGFKWIFNSHKEVYLQLVDAIKEAARSKKRFDYNCKDALRNKVGWETHFTPRNLNEERFRNGRGKLSIDAFHSDSEIGVEFQGPSVKERCYYHDFIKLCAAYTHKDIQGGIVVVKNGKNSFRDIIRDFENEKSFLKSCFESIGIPLCVLDFDTISQGESKTFLE